VLVVDANEESPLALAAGDVILSIGGRATTSPDQVLRVLGSYAADEDIPIRVRRNGREIEVMGRLND
jgi:S1-C subfamily serine protease